MGKPLADQEMDRLVVRALARLGVFAPSRSFPDRVMARVALPQPRALALFHRARAWALQPPHAIALGGSYAAVAVVALAIALPWLLANSPAIALVSDWVLVRGANLVRDAVLAVAQWSVASGLTSLVRSLPRSGPSLWVSALLLTAAYTGGAFGLHVLLRAPRRNDAIRA
jgi:hypothetical protein